MHKVSPVKPTLCLGLHAQSCCSYNMFSDKTFCGMMHPQRVNLYCADIDCRSLEIGLREWPLEVDVSVLDMGAPRIQDVTEAADGSGTGESLSEGAARPKRLLLNSARSQEADNTVSSEPEKGDYIQCPSGKACCSDSDI